MDHSQRVKLIVFAIAAVLAPAAIMTNQIRIELPSRYLPPTVADFADVA